MKTSTGERNNGGVLCIEIEPGTLFRLRFIIGIGFHRFSFCRPRGLGYGANRPADERRHGRHRSHGQESDWNLFRQCKTANM